MHGSTCDVAHGELQQLLGALYRDLEGLVRQAGDWRQCWSTAYWPMCCNVKMDDKSWLWVSEREAAFPGQIWISDGLSGERGSAEAAKGLILMTEWNLLYNQTKASQKSLGKVLHVYVWICRHVLCKRWFPSHAAAGRMWSFAACDPYREHEFCLFNILFP